MANEIFTVGHSIHSIEKFLNILLLNKIEVVADVRSSPFSKFSPQFNRVVLQDSLKAAGVRYVFLGKELGARSEDPTCYVADKVQYDRLAKTTLFQSGLNRIVEGAKTYRIAMMCAEKDPLDCHRTILVARELVKRGLSITHILESGATESNTDSISRLITSLGMSLGDMFISNDEIIEQAYNRQADRIAYDQSEWQAKRSTETTELVSGGALI
jgi:uncharacterized protein (DUF488 family)